MSRLNCVCLRADRAPRGEEAREKCGEKLCAKGCEKECEKHMKNIL